MLVIPIISPPPGEQDRRFLPILCIVEAFFFLSEETSPFRGNRPPAKLLLRLLSAPGTLPEGILFFFKVAEAPHPPPREPFPLRGDITPCIFRLVCPSFSLSGLFRPGSFLLFQCRFFSCAASHTEGNCDDTPHESSSRSRVPSAIPFFCDFSTIVFPLEFPTPLYLYDPSPTLLKAYSDHQCFLKGGQITCWVLLFPLFSGFGTRWPLASFLTVTRPGIMIIL